jgi:hypothetical protein
LLKITQVKCCLNEWKDGIRKAPKKGEGFTETKWKLAYEASVKDMKRWDGIIPEVTAQVRKTFYEKAK